MKYYGRNMDIKSHSGEISDGNEKQVIGKQKKHYLKMAKKLAELFSNVQ